jgi:hypothetical protein
MPRHRLTSCAICIRLLTMSAVWLLLLAWVVNAPRLGCVGVLFIHACISGLLFMAGTESACLHRRVLLSACIRREARLLRMLHGRSMLVVKEFLLSGLLGFALMLGVLLLQPRDWSLLFADLLLVALLLPRLVSMAAGSVREQFRYAMARHWGMLIVMLMVWAHLLLGYLFEPAADYMGLRWQEVASLGFRAPDIACGFVHFFADAVARAQALGLWAVQNYTRAIAIPTESAVLWLGLIAVTLFPLIIAYGYSRLLVGVMARPWEMWASMVDDFRAEARSGTDERRRRDDPVSER